MQSEKYLRFDHQHSAERRMWSCLLIIPGQGKEMGGTLEPRGHQPSSGAESLWRAPASNNKEDSI